jgi:hypothetical protein
LNGVSLKKRRDCDPNLVDPGLDSAADANCAVAGMGRHCVAPAVSLSIVARVIDLDQRDDRAGHSILRHEINDLLREGIAIGRMAFADQSGRGLQQRASSRGFMNRLASGRLLPMLAPAPLSAFKIINTPSKAITAAIFLSMVRWPL